jgi:hypothetical protein
MAPRPNPAKHAKTTHQGKSGPRADRDSQPVSPWLLAATEDLAVLDSLATLSAGALRVGVCVGRQNLWLILEWSDGAHLALRAASSLDRTLVLNDASPSDEGWQARVDTSLGSFVVEVVVMPNEIVRVKTTLSPAAHVNVPFWPRDLLALGPDLAPSGTNGIVHVKQKGPRSGLIFGTLQAPHSGAFLYMQDLTSLNDYARQTGTSLSDTVGGEWPELGFSLPPSNKHLRQGEPVVISDAYVAVADVPEGDAATARTFLDLLSKTYLRISRPATEYRDWPGAVRSSLRDLGKPEVWSKVGKHHYLDAYLGDKKNPPESMVQLAVLAPLIEYSEWRRRKVPMADRLERGLAAFFDERIGAVGRWHPEATAQLTGDEDHEKPRVMDSWYLYHPLLNLSRLALKGNEGAKDLFLQSLPFVIDVAHHFQYKWPVFYDIDTLEVLRAEAKPGKGGETDVAGFHAHVMLQAWKITGEDQYLKEARAAAESLTGLGFELAYQMNNTLFSAGALMELFLETGDPQYRELSDICLANVFTNVFLWECDYGNAEHYPTFFGMFPLSDAPYTAAYEEVEAIAALDHYLRLAKDGLSESLRILMPEMIRHLLNRGLSYYPPELPESVLAAKSKTGAINPKRWLPLEDLYEGREAAGQVGQQIYGAGSAFGMIVRHYWPVRKWGLMVYCDYPIDDFVVSGSSISFEVLGDPRFDCEIRLIPTGTEPLPITTLKVPSASTRGRTTAEGHRRFVVSAGQACTLSIRH